MQDLPLTEILLSMKTRNGPQQTADLALRNGPDFGSMISATHCISCDAFAHIMLSITFAIVKISYVTAVRFTAHITYKACLLEINELVGSGAGRKSSVNVKEVWVTSEWKVKTLESQMFIKGSEGMRQEFIHRF